LIKRIIIAAAALVAIALPATAARASGGCPDNSCNATQPSPLYFGEVVAGTHPVKQITLTNHTDRNQYIRKFILAGAGGGKFTLSGWPMHTCHLGMNLRRGESCTLQVRVLTTFPAWWETNLQINAGPRIMSRPKRVVWNGVIFAHVVP
jgi:hypothetical protein